MSVNLTYIENVHVFVFFYSDVFVVVNTIYQKALYVVKIIFVKNTGVELHVKN